MNNIPEFSVTEISNLTKNILEENFSLIRVKGEISSVKIFKGHLYFSIKDDTNILNAVCWVSKVPSLQVQPEDGIEVIAEGKISSYSKAVYLLINYRLARSRLKGGALLKLFDKEKKNLRRKVYLKKVTRKKYLFCHVILVSLPHQQGQ